MARMKVKDIFYPIIILINYNLIFMRIIVVMDKHPKF
jgi:hypothetical protein